jgi:predicted CXXCH cytochrome family protein
MWVRRSILLILIVGLTSSGCSKPTPAQHRLLSFFFDGVPPLEEWEEAQAKLRFGPSPEELKAKAEEKAGRKKGIGPKVVLVLHPPYRDRQCNRCHAPAEGRFFRVAKEKLCFQCHADKTVQPFIHGPAAVGACLFCHNPHEAPFQALLRIKGPRLCLNCHGQTMMQGAVYHAAIDQAPCYRCHDPHGGPARFFLVGPVEQIAKVRETAAKRPFAPPLPSLSKGKETLKPPLE